ncbi:MAG: NAD-dependent succinate-semialdehyde dehydrogenase [Saprospiraceae bacterium]|nr:NAD-dependent succinate-semialdehyde dehydrogenase [Saprospiraceae bacterium]
MQSINPFNGRVIKVYPEHEPQGVVGALDLAEQSFDEWRRTTLVDRSKLFSTLASLLRKDAEEYGQLITSEMGKPIASSIAEVQKCAWVCDYYANHAADFLRVREVRTEAKRSFVSYQPLGAILAIMPWNFPFWQVFRFAAPTLMAGNVALLKHAANVSGCALAIENAFSKVGFAEGVFQTLIVGTDRVEDLIKHPTIKGVSLTGSETAGKAVGSLAGKYLKPSLLELGGSDPYIILADADLEHAARQCCDSRLLNAGQSCIGAKRFIVVEEVYDRFLQLFKQGMEAATMGDPRTAVDLGPMARMDLRDQLHVQVERSVALGAECILGGYVPKAMGAFYPPTILVDVRKGMPAFDEEVFGPVAAVIRVQDETEAIAVANDSRFGLGASVFTKDLEKGRRLATDELEAGCCFVNQFVKSDPRLPFGGIKTSGYGRELGIDGMHAFCNTKSVWME